MHHTTFPTRRLHTPYPGQVLEQDDVRVKLVSKIEAGRWYAIDLTAPKRGLRVVRVASALYGTGTVYFETTGQLSGLPEIGTRCVIHALPLCTS